jgi:hypothetical protein
MPWRYIHSTVLYLTGSDEGGIVRKYHLGLLLYILIIFNAPGMH